MGQVEPRSHVPTIDAAVDAVFHHAGLVGVVGGEDALPAGDLPRPGVIGQRRVAGPRGRHGMVGYCSDLPQQLLASGKAQAPEYTPPAEPGSTLERQKNIDMKLRMSLFHCGKASRRSIMYWAVKLGTAQV